MQKLLLTLVLSTLCYAVSYGQQLQSTVVVPTQSTSSVTNNPLSSTGNVGQLIPVAGTKPQLEINNTGVSSSRTPLMENDDCATATDISSLFGQPLNDTQTSTIFTNAGATVGSDDQAADASCFLDPFNGLPLFANTVWFSFVADGNTYEIINDACNASSPIADNDLQFLLYQGTDCDNLTLLNCAEDISNADYRARIVFATEAGATYYLLADGYGQGAGEFCLNVTQTEIATCADINVAEATLLTDPKICFGDNLSISLGAGTVIPETNGVDGFLYVLSYDDISGSTDYFDNPSYFGDDDVGFSTNDFFVNVVSPNAFDVFYVTPAVFAGGTGPGTNVTNLDYSLGCLLAGTSIRLEYPGPIQQLAVSEEITAQDEITSVNGSIDLSVSSGSGQYSFNWSNGDTTATISDLLAGEYTVTISDLSGCVEDLIETYEVPIVSGINDPILTEAVTVYPNPAHSSVNLSYRFATTTDLDYTVVNSLGQTVLSGQITDAMNGREEIAINQLTPGTYLVRLTSDNRQAVKTLIVIR